MSARRWLVRDDQLLGGIEGFVTEARFVGAPPRVMGIGPAYAIPMVLKTAGLDVADVDLFEVYRARWGGLAKTMFTLFLCRSTRLLLLNTPIASKNSDSIRTRSTSTEAPSRLDIR